jgi:hypothetical protein
MNKRLDNSIRQWLDRYSREWDMSVEQVACAIRSDEILSRLEVYPRISSALLTSPFEIHQFAEAARQSWVLRHKMDAIRFNEFVNADGATRAIQELMSGFPSDERGAVERINESLVQIADLGYERSPGSFDWAGAAQLMSVVLTSLHPKRFVDFRQNRWSSFAKIFGYELPPSGATYGERLVWAGNFARDISETNTYQRYWQPYWSEFETLWVISGICWKNMEIKKPEAEPTKIDMFSFPEGAEKRRLHLLRERSQTVVSKAKAIALETDSLLRCQVCGFSFVETYGEIGRGFIEAHHKRPVAQLTPGSRTYVRDIGLVCANCHRMLHRGDRTLSIEELRAIVQSGQQRAVEQ